ncbi:MAG TPA: DUF1963 domain-containing protein [Vicinamibacteria bacterium]|nr:DUF1963 domain-containing protein [Vicinamibacteria bacterium]
MTDRFQIGKTEFDLAPDSAVTFEDGGMSFHLKASPVAFNKARHGKIFDRDGTDNPEPGRIAPSFRASTFFFYDDQDAPQRRIRYPQDQPATFDFRLYEGGFSFGVRFFGEIELRNDRIELRGTLRHDYEDDAKGVPVHVVRQVSPGKVALRPHTYGSLEEAMAVAPGRLRRLLVRRWEGRWRDEVLRFENLEFLSLQHVRSDRPSPDATPLPDAFCRLAHLKEIHIRGAGFTRLPERFGDLVALEVVSLQYGVLEELPDVAPLVRLRRLLLDGNRLRTLPESVGRLPALEMLSLDGNPFESLPASLQRIKSVHIEKKNEALFRDIRYRPDADVTLDREPFLARSSARHADLLAKAVVRHKLERYEKALLRHSRQALRLRATDREDYRTKGHTRIGGAPDLPPDVEYPMTDGQHWHFYAQINLDEIAPLQSWLPRTGRLYFFGEGQEQGDGGRVLHSTAPVDTLRTYEWPEGAEFVDGSNNPDPYDGYKVQVDATVSVPSLYSADRRLTGEDRTLLEINDDDDQQKSYWALETELTGDGDRKHGAHLMNAYVFTQQDNPEEQASREKGGLPGEWINLLTLDSDDKPGFCFWDAGTLTFSIHEKDLAQGDFSRVHWSLESS